MNRISKYIYLGNSYDARTKSILEESNITAILNVAGDLFQSDMGKVYSHMGLTDGPGNDKIDMLAAIDKLGELLDAGHTVLVHCHMGVSRSPTIVAAYIARNDKISLDTALDYIKRCRPIVDPHHALTDLAKEILDDHSSSS